MSIDDWVWVHTGRGNGHWMHRSLVPTAATREVVGRAPSPRASARDLEPEITESELRLLDGNR